MQKIIAQTKAREFLASRKVDSFPVDAESMAKSLGFQISYRNLRADESGFSTTLQGKKILCINSNHSTERQRFTIFHEIAHEWLKLPSYHGEESPEATLGSYLKRPEEEIACDIFAAECLVPWKLFQPFVEEESFDLDMLDYLSNEFIASRTCIASRFADQSIGLHAYVLAEDKKIVYTALSKPLRELRYWISIGVSLPRESAAYALFSMKLPSAKSSYGAFLWSSSDIANKYHCDEEAFVLPKWNQTVSVLSLEKTNRNEVLENHDTDYDPDLLPELTGYPTWKKR